MDRCPDPDPLGVLQQPDPGRPGIDIAIAGPQLLRGGPTCTRWVQDRLTDNRCQAGSTRRQQSAAAWIRATPIELGSASPNASGGVVQVVEFADGRSRRTAPSPRTSPWPGSSRNPGPAARPPRTCLLARSRTSRRRRGCGRGAPGERHGCGSSPVPAAPRRAGGSGAVGPGELPGRIAVNRPPLDFKADIAGKPVGQQRIRGVPPNDVGAQPAGPRVTRASAATPARQSSRSACSAGECEIPVGLRTNTIAVGMPAPARIPAS